MIYPALLACVGLASILVLLNFVVPRFAPIFNDPRMKIPLPTQIMLEASNFVQAYWWIGRRRWSCVRGRVSRAYIRTDGRPPVVGHASG